MSPREPTIDGLDDTDDEDGVLEQEKEEGSDLTLRVVEEQAAGLGHTPPGRDEYVEDRKEDTR